MDLKAKIDAFRQWDRSLDENTQEALRECASNAIAVFRIDASIGRKNERIVNYIHELAGKYLPAPIRLRTHNQ